MNTEQIRKIRIGDKVRFSDCMGCAHVGIVTRKLEGGLEIRDCNSGAVYQVSRGNIG
jgi:hypothetical protein